MTARLRTLFAEVRHHSSQLRTTAGERLGTVRAWVALQYDRIRPWLKPTFAGLCIAAIVGLLGYVQGPIAASILSGASAFGLSLTAIVLAAAKRSGTDAAS